MKREEVQSFLGKDWGRLTDLKVEHWRKRAEAQGEESLLAAAEQLRLHMKSLRPDWPTEEERAEDFAHHVQLTASLARVRTRSR